MADAHGGTPARVLAVCTGNVCRSPAVERLLAARLGAAYAVASAGTRALVGSPVDPPTAALLTDAGASADGFVARQVSAADVREAGLVLALSREHRSAVVRLVPSALRTTFTLRELGRLLAVADVSGLPDDPAERLAALAARARAARPLPGAAADPADDDVVDPYGGGPAILARAWAEMTGPLDVLRRALLGG